MNSANYDLYRRTFIKFQSFLADVMSLINLLITISQIASKFLLYKKMNKDIIRYILTSNVKKGINEENEIISTEKKVKHQLENIDESKKHNFSFDGKIKQNIILKSSKDSISLETINSDRIVENENMGKKVDKKITNDMKNLKINNIIKRFYCFITNNNSIV